MARREAPEVDAGSMADIAFLLLIFFIVTTTMNKDTAYLRKIPKEVKTDEPPPPIQEKDIYKITINSKNVIRARDTIIQPRDIKTLNKRIKHFYLANRNKESNPAKNYPYYAYGTISLYRNNVKSQQNRLDALIRKKEQAKNPSDKIKKMISQAKDAVSKWQAKLSMMKLYEKYSGNKKMPEIAFESHIRLESFNDTDYSTYVAVQSEIQKAVTQLRDKVAEKLFGQSYTAFQQLSQQLAMQHNEKTRKLHKRMDLIETLYPLRLIEVKPKR